MIGRKEVRPVEPAGGAPVPLPCQLRPGISPFPIVGVGASAGGLEAFTQLLAHLPDNTGMAFVLVQHLDPKYESKLGSLLAKATRMPVLEVMQGLAVRPDHVYVIPRNTTLTIAQGVLQLSPRGEARGLHLPIDQFLKSLAEDRQASAIGVILSGTGSDGTLGLTEIKAAGGITFAQDKESAKFDGMPQSAIGSGCVDFILPPEEIARELARMGRHPYLVSSPTDERGQVDTREEEHFRKIIALLRSAFGVDFTHYRDTTIKRRAMRRMVLHTKETLADYARQLEEDRSELQALYQDILINVTSFFRDPEMFEALKSSVFPEIIKTKSPGAPVRVWAAGCSTGQEAYSLAIALLEFLDEKPVCPPIQIFATDLSDAVSLERARAGLYPESIEAEVSPERLRRFFTKEDGKYRISKSIRDLCVFAKQNIVADPPFSRVDLISCRNVLIYLAPPLQKRVIPTFHYALNPTGFLMLGTSETVGGFSDLFAVGDKTHKIYSKKPTAFRQYPHFNPEDYLAGAPGETRSVSQLSPTPADLQKEADRIVLGQYAPAGVLINDTLEILQFRGRTSPYLEPAPGAASLNILKMAREGLFVELRSAITEAKTENAAAERLGVRVRDDGPVRDVNLKVVPVKLPGMSECCFLILFEEAQSPSGHEAAEAERAAGPRSSGTSRAVSWVKRLFASPQAVGEPSAELTPPDERELVQLRRELVAAREQQQLTIEQQDAANEGLKSANEEILSSNEELQSTNEELETAKEELQSVNEELTTVNEQLQNRNAELNRLNDDLANLLGSGNVPMVALGIDLRIRRFTPAAGKVLNLLPTDVGRPIGDIKPPVEVPDLEALLGEVIETVRVTEREVRGRDGHWYQLRLHPYRTADNKIDGAVMVLLDVDEIKSAQVRLRESSDYTQAIVETVREPLLILAGDLRVKSANQSFYQTFQVTPEETENQFIYNLGRGQWNIPPLRALLEDMLPSDLTFEDFEVEHEFPGLGQRVMLLNARRLLQQDGGTHLILLAFQDITERRWAEAGVRASELRYRRLFESAGDGILILDPGTRKITDVNPFMVEFLGYSRAEFLGKELWEIGLFQDAEANRDAFRELQEKGYLRYEDFPLETKQGWRREVEVVSNLYQENGHQVIQCNIRDITERKRAEDAFRESEARFAAVINHSPAIIFVKDPEGRYLLVNKPFEQGASLSRDQIIGQADEAIFSKDVVDEFRHVDREVIASGQPVVFEESFEYGGERLTYLMTKFPLLDSTGRSNAVCGIATDITDRKRAEEALREADRRKNEFLAMLGHELRNPLAPIRNAVKMMQLHGSNDPELQWARDVIDHQVQQMARLVDDLLDICRITRGKVKLHKETVDVASIVADGIETSRPFIDGRKHELSVDLPPEPVLLEADPTRLAQALANLLNNAAKYTEEGGRIWLSVARERDEAVFRVRDTGIGIPSEMLPCIFDPFIQVDRSLDRSQGGLGIGLTLVQKLVEMHGGRAEAFSDGPGQGSEFVVHLPALPRAWKQSGPTPDAPEAILESPLRRVLIVDDNIHAAESLALLLRYAGHEAQAAFDGPSALEAAKAYHPEVVLLDIGLPEMDGYEVARRLRGEADQKIELLVAMTGYAEDEARRQSKEAGFDLHLVKPIDPDAVLAMLASLEWHEHHIIQGH